MWGSQSDALGRLDEELGNLAGSARATANCPEIASRDRPAARGSRTRRHASSCAHVVRWRRRAWSNADLLAIASTELARGRLDAAQSLGSMMRNPPVLGVTAATELTAARIARVAQRRGTNRPNMRPAALELASTTSRGNSGPGPRQSRRCTAATPTRRARPSETSRCDCSHATRTLDSR